MDDTAVEREAESPIWAILVGVVAGLLAIPVVGFVTFYALALVGDLFFGLEEDWGVLLLVVLFSVVAMVVLPPIIGWTMYRRLREFVPID